MAGGLGGPFPRRNEKRSPRGLGAGAGFPAARETAVCGLDGGLPVGIAPLMSNTLFANPELLTEAAVDGLGLEGPWSEVAILFVVTSFLIEGLGRVRYMD